MSATFRSPVRVPQDFYATPPWAVRAILPHLHLREGILVLDPAAGDGRLLQVVGEHADQIGAPFRRHGIELDPTRAAHARDVLGLPCDTADALETPWPRAQIILTNPPYKLAMPFVKKALDEVASGGTVAMLLRLNWLGSLGRAEFHRTHPADVHVLPRRPSFVGGGSDATEYAWFLWRAGRGGTWRILDIGPDAPGYSSSSS